MLLGIVRSKTSWSTEFAVYKLDYLFARGVANREAFLRLPGSVQALVDLLGIPEYDCTDSLHTLQLLETLSLDPPVYETLGRVPGHLEKLVDYILRNNESGDWQSCERAAEILLTVLHRQGQSRKVLVSLPGCVRSLVGFAVKQCNPGVDEYVARPSLEVLATLTGAFEAEKQDAARTESLHASLERLRLANVPGLFEGLVDNLEDEREQVQRIAGEALAALTESSASDSGGV